LFLSIETPFTASSATCLLESIIIFIAITTYITCISLSLRRTSEPIHLTSVLGVLGTQETSYILIAGLLERDIFDLFLSEFDKPWVIHLRETCCCSTNLCTWSSNTVYKNRRVRRHQAPLLHRQKSGHLSTHYIFIASCTMHFSWSVFIFVFSFLLFCFLQ
jgi:hypothetical protein